eukprot:CAMPEP_0197193310 /NCGR_PEP_ID=MMETSP1423-20130617/26907_1 /TAXON_ID=476441 /ORGANISM="Pseudo-nitzschia heimii, Strain UNC1101" /LENGTH=169 /DNA_ID=CAMNT_0042646471 /DNA_START=111 /DNA_END=617 /DNA_ORIENTATION=+
MTSRSKRRRETVSISYTHSTTATTGATAIVNLPLPTVASCEKSEHCEKNPQPKQLDSDTSEPSTSSTMVAATPSTQSTASTQTLNHSRHKKRTKLSKLRENRLIQRAAAAIEDQLDSFEQQQLRDRFAVDSSCSNCDDFSSSLSFSAASASSSSAAHCPTLDSNYGSRQ